MKRYNYESNIYRCEMLINDLISQRSKFEKNSIERKNIDIQISELFEAIAYNKRRIKIEFPKTKNFNHRYKNLKISINDFVAYLEKCKQFFDTLHIYYNDELIDFEEIYQNNKDNCSKIYANFNNTDIPFMHFDCAGFKDINFKFEFKIGNYTGSTNLDTLNNVTKNEFKFQVKTYKLDAVISEPKPEKIVVPAVVTTAATKIQEPEKSLTLKVNENSTTNYELPITKPQAPNPEPEKPECQIVKMLPVVSGQFSEPQAPNPEMSDFEVSEDFDFSQFKEYLCTPKRRHKCDNCRQPATIQLKVPDLASFFYCSEECLHDSIMEILEYE